jgi:hypothetical protein
VVRKFGAGRVVYFSAAVDAALYSYAYPYQRTLLARAVEWAVGGPPPVRVTAPKCVQATFYERKTADDKPELVLHLPNDINTTADHGLPATDVPLREESVAIHGIRVSVAGAVNGARYSHWRVEPGHIEPRVEMAGEAATIHLPPLDVHAMLVGDV